MCACVDVCVGVWYVSVCDGVGVWCVSLWVCDGVGVGLCGCVCADS